MPCEDFVREGEEALKKSIFGKPNPDLASLKFEEAARCYKKNNDPRSAARHLIVAAKLRLEMGYLDKAAQDYEEMGILSKMAREPYQDYFITAAAMYKKVAEGITDNPLKSSEIYSKVAECFIEADRCDDAAQVYLDSAQISLKTDNYMRAIINLAGAMNCYDVEKNYNKAREISEQISGIWMAQGVFEKAMESFEKTAYYLEKMDDLQAALDFHLKAVEAAKKQGNRRFLAQCYESVAKTYLALLRKKKAGYYYFLAGEEYSAVGNNPSAIENYQKAVDAYLEGDAHKNAVTCLLKIAQIQRSENNLSASETSYLKSSEILEGEGEIEASEIVLKQRAGMWENVSDIINSARAYEGLANFAERNKKDATKFFEKAAEYHFLNAEKLAKIKNLILSKKEYEDAGYCFEKTGNLDRALECYKHSGNMGEYNRLARKIGVFESRKKEEIEARLGRIDAEFEEIEKDRRTNVLSEEDFQTFKRIYSSLKDKLESKLKE